MGNVKKIAGNLKQGVIRAWCNGCWSSPPLASPKPSLEQALKNLRPATEEELREQGENMAKNYRPGPRQAVPFLPKVPEPVAEAPARPPIFHREIQSCGEIKFVPVYRKSESDALFEAIEREIDELKAKLATRGEAAADAFERGFDEGLGAALQHCGGFLDHETKLDVFLLQAPPYTRPEDDQ